jgi:hypothetical protein
MIVNNIYVVRAHICDDNLKTFWGKITSELQNVYMVFDNSQDSMQIEFHEQNKARIILISEDYCKSINRLHQNNWSNTDSTLAIIYNRFKWYPFSYIWLIESDIFCDGNWKACLDKANRMNHDFLATYVEHYNENENKDWVHWGSTDVLPLEERVKCFFPLTRYSRQMLRSVYQNLGVFSGYCEVYISSLAKKESLWYANFPYEMIGEFDFKPVSIKSNNDNKLYHKFV